MLVFNISWIRYFSNSRIHNNFIYSNFIHDRNIFKYFICNKLCKTCVRSIIKLKLEHV
ncbi:hypothetical protein HanPSC8_Chr04g0166731 [Helianthus annuus]|nr:hypothetical protein HanPSC8_Chr04g0166731 [Helianthus annuus]